jgi:cyclic 2,3-diphosphoglycerate synthetase
MHSNAPAAARIAESRDEDFVILEGSGASLPDVHADVGVMCVAAGTEAEILTGYLGAYRLLLADLAVVTMAEAGTGAAGTEAAINETVPDLDVVHAVFRPAPLAPVRGRRAFFCCTAPVPAGNVLKEHLEKVHGCEIVGMTHRLADRAALARDIADAPPHDVLLTELKASAIEIAARSAVGTGAEVVFVSNEVVGTGVDEALARAIDLAVVRAARSDR